MQKHRIQSIILLILVMMSRQIGLASTLRSRATAEDGAVDTWQLEQGREWKPAQAKDEDKYLLVVARTEKLVRTGQNNALRKEWDKLKKLFTEIAEPDLDNFIEAELLFCRGKYIKAVRNYDKFLDKDYHESKLSDAALHRQFHIAEAFLAGRKKTVLGVFKMKGYAEGVKIMEKITDRAGSRPITIRAALAVATSYEERKMFNEAYLKWSELSWQLSNIRLAEWNTGPIAKLALLRMAQCKHASYKGPKYDASGLNSAKSYYEQFKVQYPQDAQELGVDKILAQIDEQLAQKQFSIGQYYQKTGYRLSANLYYDMVIQNWPESEPSELAREMLAQNLSSKETKK